MTATVKAPFWQLEGRCEEAYGLDGLLDEWYNFVSWVESLPDTYPLLKTLARSGRTTDRTALGHELLAAWAAHPSSDRVRWAVNALADGIVWRVVQWGKANDFQPPRDHGELVLFDEE